MLFDEPGQAITYLESRGLDVALAAVLTFVGRVTEAGNIHLQEGRTLLAAETFLLDDSPEAAFLARDAIILALWEQIAFGCIPSTSSMEADRLDNLLYRLQFLGLHNEHEDKVCRLACNELRF